MSEPAVVRCLDLTRLVSRQGRGPLTGVDRVELAYLRALSAAPEPLFLLVRTGQGYLLLDESGAQAVLARLDGVADWGPADWIGWLKRRAHPMKRRAEADLRRWAVDRCRKGRLARMLARSVPGDCRYLNVGHSNLSAEVMQAWKDHGRIAVLVHDTIPLDFPQYQRPGTVQSFEARMRRVAAHADLVICNSRATEADVTRWFGGWGRVPETLVAHLGVTMPPAAAETDLAETETKSPYFVMLGTIEPRKNHALLLDIWEGFAEELPEAEIPRLIIAGSRGWANEAVFRRLDSSPVMGRYVEEREGLSDPEIAALVAGSSGVLFPSLAEGYGLPPAEAILLGAPVICSDLPVFREFLGNIPVYADSGDVYLWKQSILRMAGKNGAGRTGDDRNLSGFDLPTWTDHFNLVLKVT